MKHLLYFILAGMLLCSGQPGICTGKNYGKGLYTPGQGLLYSRRTGTDEISGARRELQAIGLEQSRICGNIRDRTAVRTI